MGGQLSIAYPWYYLALCALVGVVVAGWMYYRDHLLAEHKAMRALLTALRAVSVAALAFLLLGPLWKGWVTRTEQPLIIYLEDGSESVPAFTPAADYKAFQEARDEMLESLERDFDVIRYEFGAGLSEAGALLPGQAKATDMAGALTQVLERHSHQHVGAVVLASDGIFNQGANPLFTETGSGTSVYTIALGDSTRQRDLFIEALQYPALVYLGDQFQLDAEWGSFDMQGQPAELRITADDGREWLRQPLTIRSGDDFGRESAVINADRAGVRTYTIVVGSAAGEAVTENNRQTAYVEVLDGRKRVLLAYASPHPDVGALRAVLEGNRNYEVTVAAIARLDQRPEDFDLVVLHGLPDVANARASEALLQQCRQSSRPVLFLVTAQTDLNLFNAWQQVLRIDLAGGQGNEVQGLPNPDFKDFHLPEDWTRQLRNYPPLVVPFADYTANPQARVLIRQRLGDLDTGYPLLIAGESQGAPVAVVAGEGLWRWRMSEHARQGSAETFDRFLGQFIQYITVSEDRRRFRLEVPGNLVWENESVRLQAALFNANYELVNDPEVTVQLTDEAGNTYPFVMDRTANAYTLNAGLLPVGNYRAVARTVQGGEALTAEARFTVRELQLERLHRQADHGLLYNLSAATGGKFYTPAALATAATDIREDVNLKPVLYRSETTRPLLRFTWIFAVLLALLTTEWVVRKYLGAH